MSIPRNLLLLTGAAIAALAFTANAATAQETGVEVINEATGNPCNPCIITARGEATIRLVSNGAILSSCVDQFEADVSHNGSGEIYAWIGFAHAGSNCSVTPCAPDERDWDITNLGELGDGLEHMRVRLCMFIPAFNQTMHCNGEFLMADGSGNHDYLLAMHGRCLANALEVEGIWETKRDENHNNIELVHQDG